MTIASRTTSSENDSQLTKSGPPTSILQPGSYDTKYHRDRTASTRHQDSPPEYNPPGPRKLKEQEPSTPSPRASLHRRHGPARESAPPPRPYARVSTASTALRASQHRLHSPTPESAPPPRPYTRVSTSSPPRVQHSITRHETTRATRAQHQHTKPGAPKR